MTVFENQNTDQEAQASSTPQTPPEVTSSQSSQKIISPDPDVSTTFKGAWEYMLNFIKAPVSTLKNKALEPADAAILLGLLPIAYFTSMWSLIRGLIDTLISFFFANSFGLGWGTPSLAQMRSEALAEVNWGSTFFNGLITSAIWFALMMFVPLVVARLFKNTQPVDTKKLFSKMVSLTIPVTLLFFIATLLGLISLWLWLLPVATSLILPMILHFIIIRDLFNETADKAIYISFITQIIILVVLGFWLNSQINSMFTSMMMDGLW